MEKVILTDGTNRIVLEETDGIAQFGKYLSSLIGKELFGVFKKPDFYCKRFEVIDCRDNVLIECSFWFK